MVAGDLGEPRFGLSEDQWLQLASSVDVIFHNGYARSLFKVHVLYVCTHVLYVWRGSSPVCLQCLRERSAAVFAAARRQRARHAGGHQAGRRSPPQARKLYLCMLCLILPFHSLFVYVCLFDISCHNVFFSFSLFHHLFPLSFVLCVFLFDIT